MGLISFGIELDVGSNLPVLISLQSVLSGATAHQLDVEHIFRNDVAEVANTTTEKAKVSAAYVWEVMVPFSPPPLGPYGGVRQAQAP